MKFSLSGSLASMANGLPYSIAAAVAFREGLAKGDSKHAYQIILTVLKDKAREIL